MSAYLFHHQCRNGHSFNAPGAREFAYGEFVMRTPEGSCTVYLDAFADPVFSEAGNIVKVSPLIQALNDWQIGEIQQKAFSIACDLAPNGLPFQIGVLPHCPLCGIPPNSFAQVFPPVTVELPVPTHIKWNSLTVSEKSELIAEFIERYLLTLTDKLIDS